MPYCPARAMPVMAFLAGSARTRPGKIAAMMGPERSGPPAADDAAPIFRPAERDAAHFSSSSDPERLGDLVQRQAIGEDIVVDEYVLPADVLHAGLPPQAGPVVVGFAWWS